ncbi:MAG TPA: serine/threonine-protein kinase [Gaiellaceae bacterium]|nr:serine/threonine-protein kinase [Gaiellaceae bacterium]
MPSEPRIGTVFAGYRIEGICGRGGMSVVYRAENLRLGNAVALKLLAAELAEDEGFRERFVRESRTAASLLHPHIIPIYDAGDAEGILYIAMRYVDGPDLKALAREGALTPERVLRIGAQVASALDAAHERGLIHRDVKPANVLLEAGPGGEDHAYLADFGLTKNVDSHSGITGTGQFVGTIDYMAPEQIEGREVDSRVDVYALGCVLFECLAGVPPYPRESEVAVLWAHMRDEPPAVSAVRPELPPATDDALAWALSKDPADRPGTCGELIDALRGALGVSSQAGAATVRVGAKPKGRAAWGRGHAIAAGLIGLAVGAGIASALLVPGRGTTTKVVTTVSIQTSFLKPLIPEPVRRTCQRAPKLSPDFFETFACRPGHGVATAQYNLVRGGTLMTQDFLKRLRLEGIPLANGKFTTGGDCSIGENAVQYWVRRNKRGGHDQATSTTPFSDIRGIVFCHHDQHRSWIEWTDNRLNVYTVASGSDPTQLYQWWATRAGPLS